jgi:hypothetical protein
MIPAALFVLVAAVMCAAVVLAIFAVTYVYYLSSSRALEDDGLPRGTAAPAWSLADSSGKVVCSPPQDKPLQLIMFTDHSLKSFPSVVTGLLDLLQADPRLEIAVLMRGPSALAEPLLGVLGLGEIPILGGSSALYGKYNVRVMPFAIFVDSRGRVRGSSLVNHAWQIERLWRLASVTPDPGEMLRTGRSRRRPVGAGA